MMKELISIIIPVYNVEQYIRKCIESVIAQTYTNLEIIIVDDGSTDNSGKICDEFALNDARIRVYHRKNGGAAAARNYGLMHAHGEFIGFVDSDDYIDVDMYETILSYMDNDVDIVACGRYICPFDQRRERITLRFTTSKCAKFNNEQAMLEWLKHRIISFGVYDKLFRQDVIKNVRFPNGRVCEDIPFTYYALKNSRNVVHIGIPKYYSFHSQNSVSRRPFFYRRIDNAIFLGEICRDVCVNYPEYIKYADYLYIQSLIFILGNMRQSEDREKYEKLEKRIKMALRHFVFRMCCNEHMSMAEKKRYLIETFS